MSRRLRASIFLMVAAVAGFAGYHFNTLKPATSAIDLAARNLMLASFDDLSSKKQTLSSSLGKVLVVNFWATWCLPCREEIPELKKIQRKYAPKGVEVTGIAFDSAVKVQDYAKEMNIDYSLLIANAETMAISQNLGNRAGVLPFTVVLDRAGRVAYTHAGALTEAVLDAVLGPLL